VAAPKKVGPGTHIAHMVICVCTLGFVFPNAFVENMDPIIYLANDDVGKAVPPKP
jgi:hypothetical protein